MFACGIPRRSVSSFGNANVFKITKLLISERGTISNKNAGASMSTHFFHRKSLITICLTSFDGSVDESS